VQAHVDARLFGGKFKLRAFQRAQSELREIAVINEPLRFGVTLLT
jgi:hypothetical protein